MLPNQTSTSHTSILQGLAARDSGFKQKFDELKNIVSSTILANQGAERWTITFPDYVKNEFMIDKLIAYLQDEHFEVSLETPVPYFSILGLDDFDSRLSCSPPPTIVISLSPFLKQQLTQDPDFLKTVFQASNPAEKYLRLKGQEHLTLLKLKNIATTAIKGATNSDECPIYHSYNLNHPKHQSHAKELSQWLSDNNITSSSRDYSTVFTINLKDVDVTTIKDPALKAAVEQRSANKVETEQRIKSEAESLVKAINQALATDSGTDEWVIKLNQHSSSMTQVEITRYVMTNLLEPLSSQFSFTQSKRGLDDVLIISLKGEAPELTASTPSQ